MSFSLLGGLDKILSGGSEGRMVPAPQLFGEGTVGKSWYNYLKDLYATPTDQTPQFKRQSMALRDALSMESEGQKDEFSQATNAGGFYDSGARLTGLNDINRNRLASYSQGLASILSKLESDKMAAAFPFIQSQIGEFNAFQGAKQGAEGAQTARSGQNKQFVSDALGSIMGGGGGGGFM